MTKKEQSILIFDFFDHLVDSGRYQAMKVSHSSTISDVPVGWATSNDRSAQIEQSIKLNIATRKEIKSEIDHWLSLEEV